MVWRGTLSQTCQGGTQGAVPAARSARAPFQEHCGAVSGMISLTTILYVSR